MNTQRAPNGFAYDPTLWSLLRIQPASSAADPPETPYTVLETREIWSFTPLDFIATAGGVLTASVFLYMLLWGQRRLDPWGIMQRIVFRSVPIRMHPAISTPQVEQTEISTGEPKDENKNIEMLPVGSESPASQATLNETTDLPSTDMAAPLALASTFASDAPLVRVETATPPPIPPPRKSSGRRLYSTPDTTMREDLEGAIGRALSRRESGVLGVEIEEDGSILRRRGRARSDGALAFGQAGSGLQPHPVLRISVGDLEPAESVYEAGDREKDKELVPDTPDVSVPLPLVAAACTCQGSSATLDARIHEEMLTFGELLGRYYLSDVLDVRMTAAEETPSRGRR
jgi:hypothetical protein